MRMEVSSSSTTTSSVAISIALIVVTTCACRLLNWVWFRPKKLERYLKQQNLNGKPYRLLFGDLQENATMINEAISKPIDIYDGSGIVPRVMPFMHQTVKNYGKSSYIWVGTVPRVNIMNPEDVRDIFMRTNEFRTTVTNPLVKLLVSGIVSHDGEKWAYHRKIITPAFHLEKLKLMVPVFGQCCNEMINKWEKLLSLEGSLELDVWPHLQTLTCDVISRTAFGSNYKEGERIFYLLKEQANHVIQVQQSSYLASCSFLPTKTSRRMKAIDREIQAILKVIIRKKEKAIKEGDAAAEDLLSALIKSNSREIQEHGNNKSIGMSNKDVIDECKLFYLAGQETTSVLLAWTIILLGQYPNWQARAREEVLQVFGNSSPDFHGLNHLKVVTMILHEVLRLYPPAVTIIRNVYKETKLGNLLLPAGVQVCIPTVLIHHDREIWGDDASDFNPEKFSEGVAKATKNQVVFVPVGWGPRMCVGWNFALVEAKMALAKILQKFSVELSPSYLHAPFSFLTLLPQYGAQVILHKY